MNPGPRGMRGAPVAQRLAELVSLSEPQRAAGARASGSRLLLDIAGLCVAARRQDYVRAVLDSIDGTGPCTAIGHTVRFDVDDAALINGVAAHGEDFDDTYEGGPVHAGAVIVPAALACCERHGLGGEDLLRAIAVGAEVTCRLCRVAPTRIHKAGFHPTAILGVIGATAAVGAALRVRPEVLVNAFGIAGSLAAGIIEYLADGSWTKRLHPGWAAQSGYRAVRLASGGFIGPRTVFEGNHGLFKGFASSRDGDYEAMFDGFEEEWVWQSIAFKPYACGTMAHPYIDCARAFRARGIAPGRIVRIDCETAEGIVHRLWEPLHEKQAPPNGYAAKFSIPYAVAIGILRDDAGLSDFDKAVVDDPAVVELAGKVNYVIDPGNPYPNEFTGHLRVSLDNGETVEHRQAFFKGGAEHPLSDDELRHKFRANCRYGGLSQEQTDALAARVNDVFDQRVVFFGDEPPARMPAP
ncbi:MAG TPA: MmgE/PrpD family protein [Burkholderiaceae bacterium]|nr:MmgE/PrpD family protein [Burkholderiaceae bacterium]